jgi:hypothetical protein
VVDFLADRMAGLLLVVPVVDLLPVVLVVLLCSGAFLLPVDLRLVVFLLWGIFLVRVLPILGMELGGLRFLEIVGHVALLRFAKRCPTWTRMMWMQP